MSGNIQPARFLSHTGKILPGVRRVVQVPNPAPATGWNVTVPAGVQWYVLAGYADLATDATVGNRFIGMKLTVNGVLVKNVATSGAIAPSSTAPVNFGSGPGVQSGQTGAVYGLVPLSNGLLPTGSNVAMTASGYGAGDQWSSIALWIEEVYVTDSQLSEIQRERETLQRDIDIYEYEQAMQGQGS